MRKKVTTLPRWRYTKYKYKIHRYCRLLRYGTFFLQRYRYQANRPDHEARLRVRMEQQEKKQVAHLSQV
jgi:hypothetical protein